MPHPKVKVTTYTLPPTPLIPNSPYPLLHFPALLHPLVTSPTFHPTQIFDLYASNGWQAQWIARYGPDIQSHYHSTTHECMVVIAGDSATIRFGVADDPAWSTGKLGIGERGAGEEGGVDVVAGLGDVFLIPAGVAHKTFDTRLGAGGNRAFYQPEDIEAGRAGEVSEEMERRHREFFGGVEVGGGFMMMGAYPYGGVWDFKVGGEHGGREDEVWGVPRPGKDPVLGDSSEGLLGLWKEGAGRTGR